MSRSSALRTLARSDPEAFLQAALDTGVVECAGYAGGDPPQLWPDGGRGRDPLYRPGELMAAYLGAKQQVVPRGEGSDCPSGKAQYTKEGARAERDRLRAEDPTIKVYRCQQCDCFHLGHTRREDKRRALR